MFQKFKIGWVPFLVITLAVVVAGTGIALANNQDDDNVIYGCYQKNNGQL